MDTPPARNVEFASRRQSFFDGLRERLAPAMRLHEYNGLVGDWINVTEHCLLQAARVEVLAGLIGLDDGMTNDLVMAAALHDAYKKQELQLLSASDFSWESYIKAQVDAEQQLRDWCFASRAIDIAKSVAHETTPDMWSILQPLYGDLPDTAGLHPLDLAKLIMHYTDDYTIDAGWAAMKEMESTGETISPLEQRIRSAEANEKYKVINQSGVSHFGGATSYTAQRAVGLEVERLLTDMVNQQTGSLVADGELPLYVDQIIIGATN